MKYPIIAIVMLCLFSTFSWAADPPGATSQLENEKDKISYSLGYQIGNDYKKQKSTIDSQAFLQGMQDALAQSPPAVAPEAMKQKLMAMKQKLMVQQRKEQQEIREQYHAAAEKFFTENAGKEGVVVLPSGLQYKIIRPGTGKKPGPADRVIVNYTGTFIDGNEFGSSRNKEAPQTFSVDKVVPGLTEGLQLMQEGAQYVFFVPADLAYGRRGPLENRAVIFDIELISVESAE
jgi:FKBP-type peptidyl-prolyl cis-trans isomerase FklB